MDWIINFARGLVDQPLNVLLMAALITIFLLWRKDVTKFDLERVRHAEELKSAYERSEERDAQYTTLVREAVTSLTRVADVLK